MSGVSIVNQFTFIFNLLVFGVVSAGGIFTAQYHGKKDINGVRNAFRLKIIMNFFAGILGVVLFIAPLNIVAGVKMFGLLKKEEVSEEDDDEFGGTASALDDQKSTAEVIDEMLKNEDLEDEDVENTDDTDEIPEVSDEEEDK